MVTTRRQDPINAHMKLEKKLEGACSACGPGSGCTQRPEQEQRPVRNHQNFFGSSSKQRGESSERDHAALDRSEVERLEDQRVREGSTA